MDFDAQATIKLVLAGVFGLAFFSFVVKDGQQLGSFITDVGKGTASFAKGIQA